MLVPFVEPVTTFTYSRKNLDWYIERQHQKQWALPAAEVDRLLEKQETALLQAAQSRSEGPPPADAGAVEPTESEPPDLAGDSPIWNRTPQSADQVPPTASRKRGPKPDRENYAKVAALIRSYGENWTTDDNLVEICDELDRQGVPVPKTWLMRKEGPARSWSRGRQNYAHLVIKAIKDRCKAASSGA